MTLDDTPQAISETRAAMAQAENQMRDLIKHGKPTGELPFLILQMRKDLVVLIRERDALGGSEAVPAKPTSTGLKRFPSTPGPFGR